MPHGLENFVSVICETGLRPFKLTSPVHLNRDCNSPQLKINILSNEFQHRVNVREAGKVLLKRGGHLQPTAYVKLHFTLLFSTLHGITIKAT